MNDAMIDLRKPVENSYVSKDVLHIIEQTITELEVYLESNPDDEIAQVQYRQFLGKREGFMQVLTENYDEVSDSKMRA